MINDPHSPLPISRQCALVGIPRSSYYYQPREKKEEDLQLMRKLDEQYTQTPFYGSRRLTQELKRQGYSVNRKRIRRLMGQMGISAVYPQPNLSRGKKEHWKYPYLLRDMSITRPNQVWSTDITYIRLQKGFIYLVAVIDWHSRYVLSWETSTTLDKEFCLRALDRALNSGMKPEIFNTDQGVQFTSQEFTGRLKEAGIQISMDGRGRALDNIFIERLWRSLKHEEVYLKEYQDVRMAKEELGRYFEFYNHRRLHQSLGYQTPAEVYYQESMKSNSIYNISRLSNPLNTPCFFV